MVVQPLIRIMPERALRNTDKRIGEGKPVIPAFLFACMLWDPVKADAQVLMEDGTPEPQAWRIAMSDALRDQDQYVAVPKRLAEIILDIWNIHFRLIKRNPRMVKACLNNRRFRAAYDFLLLRTMVHEVDEEIGHWWGEIQTVEAAEREAMITEVSKTYKQDRRPRRSNNQNNEANGNEINYNSAEYNPGYDDGLPQSQNIGAKTKPNHSRKKPNNDRRGGQRPNQNKSRQAQGDGQSRQSPNGSRNRNNNNSSNRNRSNSNRGSGGGRGGSNWGAKRGGRSNPAQGGDGRYQDAQPKDDFGNHSSSEATQKKVKVRRKRRIVTDADTKKTDDTPHF